MYRVNVSAGGSVSLVPGTPIAYPLAGGIDVVVDFHTHDSYIYVPQRIYALYMSSVSLGNVHGSKRLRFGAERNETGDSRRRSIVSDDGVLVAPPAEQRKQFHARLEEARQRHADRSVYYRNSLHRFTMSQWLPLRYPAV